jgi:hypothetical protein
MFNAVCDRSIGELLLSRIENQQMNGISYNKAKVVKYHTSSQRITEDTK